MKRNMKQWVADTLAAPTKKPMPILSFPAIQKMGITVKELIASSDLQAQCMKIVADEIDAAASVSLMDLSLEAECFGSTIRVFDDEVPTVIGSIVSSEEDADALQVPEIGAGRTSIYIEAIEKAVKLIEDRPVFAGVIGPFSLAGRLMDVTEAMIYCYDEPDMVHTVLEKVTDFMIKYILEYKNNLGRNIDMSTDYPELFHLMTYCNSFDDPNDGSGYVAGASFIDYLISRFGEEKVLDIICVTHDFGEYRYEELVTEWQTFLEKNYSQYSKIK